MDDEANRFDAEDVSNLWNRFLEQPDHGYTELELRCARALVGSAEPFYSFVGRIVLLDSAQPTTVKMLAFIEEECAKGLAATKSYAHDLLYLLLNVTVEHLQRPAINSFIKAAAQFEKTHCRQNATHLLAKLTSSDSEALGILQTLSADPDPSVKRNAAILLMRLHERQE